MKTIKFLSVLLGLFSIAPTANALECTVYFKAENLCATVDSLYENNKYQVQVVFWDRSQGEAQQPVFADPDAAKINFKQTSVKDGTSNAIALKAVESEYGGLTVGGYALDTTDATFVTLPQIQDLSDWKIQISFLDANGVVTDSATTP